MPGQSQLPTLEDVRLLVNRALPENRVTGFEILSGGLINTNIKVGLDSDAAVVLRLYRDGADVCRKEAALLRLVRDTVPVPEVLYAYVEGHNPIPRILDTFLASPNLNKRASTELIERLHDFAWSWAPRLPQLDNDCSLVHSDFGNRNILVHEQDGEWSVAAVIDWEFAFSGSPLLDVGHFLRYERNSQPLREPHFSRAFVEHGGRLPDDWRHIARAIDLTGLVECLTHDQLPADVEAELLDLVHAALEGRDPSRDF